jgi:hypothetical protein
VCRASFSSSSPGRRLEASSLLESADNEDNDANDDRAAADCWDWSGCRHGYDHTHNNEDEAKPFPLRTGASDFDVRRGVERYSKLERRSPDKLQLCQRPLSRIQNT